jgi:hypothetical protein
MIFVLTMKKKTMESTRRRRFLLIMERGGGGGVGVGGEKPTPRCAVWSQTTSSLLYFCRIIIDTFFVYSHLRALPKRYANQDPRLDQHLCYVIDFVFRPTHMDPSRKNNNASLSIIQVDTPTRRRVVTTHTKKKKKTIHGWFRGRMIIVVFAPDVQYFLF